MSIEIKNLSKNYKSVQALDDVSIRFEENKIYGLLGRNGAGKTTLLNIITNRIFADRGEVFIDDIPSKENDQALQKVYLMSEKNFYPDKMKIKDIFRWTGEFYGKFDMESAMNMAEKFELSTNKVVKGLSTGYTSIFKVIIALSVNTPYVLLDEPVLGLDANHRDLFYKLLIEKYSEKPSTIIVSTHLIEEVSNVIENVVVIKKGKIIKDETREELLTAGYTISGSASLVDQYILGKSVIGLDVLGGLKSAYILGELEKDKLPEGLEVSRMDLQKLFIQMTNA
ncbi:ABC transporter ATP-binding protein [Mobilitalea sibirica]|uniref:ABC transporter ATP-binding protein n=1 Tax=Mobilitalea sibirica TaxID=1462919 RepID=A0A8J7KWN3_9FIRM|nr:ABC transporter ATP-binding protein [Mobilitalea sibirica]MBH1940692.1 ABC transporter ATP-binding protein [Mobilitalea sibirica]